MKILRITLSNIASIAGTHTVDFTQEPLRSAGLFAISGPTGAGKSTLLDALCLALYERTPRLDGVTRKPDIDNESQNAPESLLRRGTGKGFVEVAFVGVDNLPWTARWEVRRARETADGTLQDATMVLYKGHVAPDTKGEVEAGDKKTAVLKAIESKIGLSYDQFTRAVLIAQNDFASFLKVKDKDRADILQKLTGTQQYEQISKNVYLRCQDFVDRLKEKNTLVQGNLPLSIEERERVEESYAIAKKEAEEFETKLSELKKKDTWYRKWTELNDAHAEAEIAYQAVQVENTQALTRQRDLALTEAIKHEAAKLSSDQKTVQSERDVLSQSLAVEEGKIEGLNRDLEIASQAFAHANSALITWKQQESGLRDEIDLARRVDVKIALKAQMCEAAQKSTEEAAEAYKEKQLELDGKNVELGQLKRDLGRIEEDLEFLKPYFTLVEDARLWISHIENALSLENQIIEKQSTLANTQAEVIAAKALVDQQQEKHQPILESLHDARRSHDDMHAELQQIDIERIEKERSIHEKSLSFLRVLKGRLQNRIEKIGQRDSLQVEIDQNQRTQAYESSRWQTLTQTEIPKAQEAFEVLQTLQKKIAQTLEDRSIELRQALVEGKACPVCGSLDHPYSHTAPTEDSVALQTATVQVRQHEKKLIELSTEARTLVGRLQEREESIAEKQEKLRQLNADLSGIVFDNLESVAVATILSKPLEEQIPEADKCCNELEQEIKNLDDARTHYRNKAKELEGLRRSVTQYEMLLKQAKESLVNLEKQANALVGRCSAIEVELSILEQNKERYLGDLKPVLSAVPFFANSFQVNGVETADRFKADLARCELLRKRQQEILGRIERVNEFVANADSIINILSAEKKVKEEGLKSLLDEFEELKKQRAQLLDNRNVQDVECDLVNKKESLEKGLEDAKKSLDLHQRRLGETKDRIDLLRVSLDSANSRLLATNSAFESWLQQFSQKHQCTLSLEQIDEKLKLDFDWMNRERGELAEITNRLSKSLGELETRRKILESHVEQRPTEDSHATVTRNIQELQDKLKHAMSRVEKTLTPLTIDNEKRKKNVEILDELETLQEHAKPWQQLNEVIGNAAGTKFAAFAQQFSLDILLQYSNQHLREFAPRYRLKRLPASLNLVVNDCDMGDEVRSIHSLSGGETFLVSLAMALGLASLTSYRVRIESLFIDEGFGSLDPETLNVAMGALMQLESQGRKVGVISHVPEMAEAIPVQIKVKKGRNGASRLEIPGVNKS